MLTLLNPKQPDQPFPPVEQALDEPDGLLAVGGCLSVPRLLNAYRQGIFPWYGPDEPLLWWSPDPRMVLFPEKFKTSRSLRKTLNRQCFEVSYDLTFASVIAACAEPRVCDTGTWISPDMKKAYTELHQSGYAHSIEVWQNKNLVGGLYGVALGQVFYGESMFHQRTDASKVGFAYLVNKLREWNYHLIDCQVQTEHLISLGAEEIAREHFISLLNNFCNQQPLTHAWRRQSE